MVDRLRLIVLVLLVTILGGCAHHGIKVPIRIGTDPVNCSAARCK